MENTVRHDLNNSKDLPLAARLALLLAVVGMLSVSAACGKEEEPKENVYQIYVVSNSETKVEMRPREMRHMSGEEGLAELLEGLSATPDKLEYKAPLAMGFRLLERKLEEGKLQLNVDSAYLALSPTTEVLVRAALVRTLTQLPEVNYVGISVEGNQLFDNAGEAVGWMSAEQFINNNGNEINTYESTRVKLYFANEGGDKLIAAYREKYYSTNVPLERFVVEELIAGPSGRIEGLYPSVNPEVKIINVMTKDGICYVNLDASFLTVVNNVSTEISIYSIVNSLAELSTVNKVQILINGEVPAGFANSVYERNLDCVTKLE